MEVLTRKDSVQFAAAVLKERRARQVLLVTGSYGAVMAAGVFTASFETTVLQLPALLIESSEVERLARALKAQPDAIVAIGGGRVLDLAKLVLLAVAEKSLPYFIALPTTAGSGSEATPFAVLYDKGVKRSVEDGRLLPQLVLLDASHLQKLPSRQRAISGADALAQSIESAWSLKATGSSQQIAFEAFRQCWALLPGFVRETNGKRDEAMLQAAHLAGRAIAHTRTTGPHALSYYLTSMHGVPHGQAVALFLPLFIVYNSAAQGEWVQTAFELIYELTGADNPEDAALSMQEYLKGIALAASFTDLNITVDTEALLDSVNRERFGNNPVPYDRKRLAQLIDRYLVNNRLGI